MHATDKTLPVLTKLSTLLGTELRKDAWSDRMLDDIHACEGRLEIMVTKHGIFITAREPNKYGAMMSTRRARVPAGLSYREIAEYAVAWLAAEVEIPDGTYYWHSRGRHAVAGEAPEVTARLEEIANVEFGAYPLGGRLTFAGGKLIDTSGNI